MMLGLDYVAGGQLAALPKFKEQFGVIQSDGSYIVPARYLSAWASIGPACDIVAALIAVPFLEKYGRKPQIMVAAVISTVGILLQQMATEWKMHLAGRAVNGKHLPLQTEIYAPKLRIKLYRGCDWYYVYYLTTMDWRDMSARAPWVLFMLLQQ